MNQSTRRVLLVGLGNPMHEYSRHNCGKYVIDHLVYSLGYKWKPAPKVNGSLAEGLITLPIKPKSRVPPKPNNKDASLYSDSEPLKQSTEKKSTSPELPVHIQAFFLKSNEFMNNNGKSVRSALKLLSLPISSLIVFHDDMDTLIGKFSLKKGGSPNGHNGVKSIIDCIGSKDFKRIRIGIGRPEGSKANPLAVTSHVLSAFNRSQLVLIDSVSNHIYDAYLHNPPLLGID
ncbi:Peptidyl-tRNA hydrolase [Smittium mucronatum]|uniref:peptidyl-tRNA hydrolase n=1 Tax=Smittium mucronatum TaxID=133383 RepID=A0A1R0GLX1_9FUNG|nr:Peptidyl-tRNA hydrolase [Smittium mucronatum]